MKPGDSLQKCDPDQPNTPPTLMGSSQCILQAINTTLSSTLLATANAFRKQRQSSISDQIAQINKDATRDPVIASLLFFLRYNQQPTAVQLGSARVSISAGQKIYSVQSDKGYLAGLSPSSPRRRKSSAYLNVTGTKQKPPDGHKRGHHKQKSSEEIAVEWNLDSNSKALLASFISSSTQGIYRPTFILKTAGLIYDEGKPKHPAYTKTDNRLSLVYNDLPHDENYPLYVREMRVGENSLSLRLQGGLSVKLDKNTNHGDLYWLREFVAAHCKEISWIDRGPDKFELAATCLGICIAACASLGVLAPTLSTLAIALLAATIALSAAATAAFSALAGRAFNLLHKPLSQELHTPNQTERKHKKQAPPLQLHDILDDAHPNTPNGSQS